MSRRSQTSKQTGGLSSPRGLSIIAMATRVDRRQNEPTDQSCAVITSKTSHSSVRKRRQAEFRGKRVYIGVFISQHIALMGGQGLELVRQMNGN